MNTIIPSILKESSAGFVQRSITDELFEKRQIELVGDITPESAHCIIMQLRYLESVSNEEITLFVNSNGGDVASGLAVYDIMKSINCPIRAVCIGTAASMAAVLFSSGDTREMFEHSRIMIHDPLICGVNGSALSVDNTAKQLMKTRDILAKILAQNTGRSIDEILARTSADCYFDAKEAVEFGLADRIITSL